MRPTISVSTKNIDGKITINVINNGNDILQKAVNKNFQPFFTTKHLDKEMNWD
jgi:C4-dicarboxylate-specific signal transduction histidine kinase